MSEPEPLPPEPIEVETPGGIWTVDATPCADLFSQSPEVIDYATTLATHWLYRLTGRRFGIKPVTIRPCGSARFHSLSTYAGRTGRPGTLVPINSLGATGSFACSSCFTTPSDAELTLPISPAHSLVSVKADGVALPLTDFAILDHRLLVSSGDFRFPRDQNPAIPDTEPGTYSITYTHGSPVPRDGEFAAGYLANELAKACAGIKCALPRRVQSVARQGVSIQIVDNPDFLRDGLVGLTEVDQFIVSVNPHGLHSRSRSYNPDTLARYPKRSTWVPSP